MNKSEALEHLVKIGRSSAGQSAPARQFLGAWEEASKYGGFDVRDLGWVDDRIADAMLDVMGSISRGQKERPLDYAKNHAPHLVDDLVSVLQERLEDYEAGQSARPAP